MRAIECLLLAAFLVGHLNSQLSIPLALSSEEPASEKQVPQKTRATCAIQFLSGLGWKLEGGGKDKKVLVEKENRKLLLPSDFDSLVDEVKYYLLEEALESPLSHSMAWDRLSLRQVIVSTGQTHNTVMVAIPTELKERVGIPYFLKDNLFKIGTAFWIERTTAKIQGWIASEEEKEKLKKALELFYLKSPDARFWDIKGLAIEVDSFLFSEIRVTTDGENLSSYWKRLQKKNPFAPVTFDFFAPDLVKENYRTTRDKFFRDCQSGY